MGGTAMLSIFEGRSGLPVLVADSSGALVRRTEQALASLGADWRVGIGPGTVVYSVDRPDDTGSDRIGLLVAEASVTELARGNARHLSDPGGSVARRMRDFVAGLDASAAGQTASLLSAITIGGEPLLPANQLYEEQPRAKVAGSGMLANGCIWSFDIKVSTAAIPIAGDTNCVFHLFKIEATLSEICVNKSRVASETRISRTGPHCRNQNETPPTAVPQPGTASNFRSSRAAKDGVEEVRIELPDGTNVTITTPPNGVPTVRLDYPGGSPTILSINGQ